MMLVPAKFKVNWFYVSRLDATLLILMTLLQFGAFKVRSLSATRTAVVIGILLISYLVAVSWVKVFKIPLPTMLAIQNDLLVMVLIFALMFLIVPTVFAPIDLQTRIGGMGVLIALITFPMSYTAANPWYGVRFPWARSQTNRRQTNILGARLGVLVGVLIMLMSTISLAAVYVTIIVGLISLVLAVTWYTTYLSRRGV
ncbi:SdpI family protein [Lactiplantibacillus fabifermentans]|nr:SdpI family protein [Lactiplantibacillus fabifermentans]